MQKSQVKQKARGKFADLEMEINAILIKNNLSAKTNAFFKQAAQQQEISIQQAYTIAYNWREITKRFLFTSVTGLGRFAEHLAAQTESSSQQLSVFQNVFRIIGDDLNNNHPIFQQTAPNNPAGIHYRWWEIAILDPLAELYLGQPIKIFPGTKELTDKMVSTVQHYLGVTVQLRIVEAIALDICIAFFDLFGHLQCDGKNVFTTEQLEWVTTHINAEKIHHQQVCSHNAGMVQVVTTNAEHRMLLHLAEKYSRAWALALQDFADCISQI